MVEEEKQRASDAKGLQKTYLQKADDLEDKIIRELQEAYPGMQDMDILFYSQYDSEWNDLLNEVWGVLEESLPKDEFEQLQVEQKEWVTTKEQDLAEMPGETSSERGTAAGLTTMETSNRTYFLIENFME